MPEILKSHENTAEEQSGSGWEELRSVPFHAEDDGDAKEQHADASENGENLNLQYETELLSPEDVKDDIARFVIRDGKVYDRTTREEVSDIDTILRAKTSRFLYNEALSDQNDLKLRAGKHFVDQGIDSHIDKMMQKYAIRDEENVYGPNKIVRGLVENGEYSDGVGTPTVDGTKFDMFAGVKADYGRALIERKMRQRGKTVTGLELTVDDSHLVHDGHIIVTVKMDTEPLQQNDDGLHHPAAEKLQELDAKLIEAKQSGNQAEAHKILMQLRKVVSEQPLVVSQEQFKNMTDDEKKRYFMLKYKEAQVLGVKKMEDYWKQQALNLRNGKKN